MLVINLGFCSCVLSPTLSHLRLHVLPPPPLRTPTYSRLRLCLRVSPSSFKVDSSSRVRHPSVCEEGPLRSTPSTKESAGGTGAVLSWSLIFLVNLVFPRFSSSSCVSRPYSRGSDGGHPCYCLRMVRLVDMYRQVRSFVERLPSFPA